MPMLFVHWGYRFRDGMDLAPVIRRSFLADLGADTRKWPHHIDAPDSRPADELGVRDGEYVIAKTDQDAFASSNIGFVLENLGVRRIVFVGGHAGACLGKTAASAKRLGYETLCVVDATNDAAESRRMPNLRATGYEYLVTTERFLALARASHGLSGTLETQLLEYTSSVDGVGPLKADATFVADGRRKPLLVIMHGYSQGRSAVSADAMSLARRGVFALAPDMRGRGDSAGDWDSGGLDVHDILDAVLAAVRRWPREIDAANLNIVGYSGGGGNAIACMARFPDLFRNYVSFFGISDYAAWFRSGGRPDCNKLMQAALGGGPDDVPDAYLARNMIPAAANCRAGALWFFWDEDEKQCPPGPVEAFVRAYRSAGLRRAAVHVSRRGDTHRWIHGSRTDHPGLAAADDVYMPSVQARGQRPPRMPSRGRLVVPGYVVTRWFQVWVEDGRRGQVTVAYSVRNGKASVRVVANPGGYRVRVELTSPLAALPPPPR